jgi:hypothetical protein
MRMIERGNWFALTLLHNGRTANRELLGSEVA